MRIEPFVKVVLLGLLALTFVPALAGAGPIISVSPASHDFGRVNVGTTSASFDFTVSNIGDATLIVTLPLTHSSPGFSASIASTNIPPGASTLLHTSYTPSGSGPQSDNVTISSNASNGNANVLLRGTANNAPVCNPPLSSNYFACASVAFSLTASATDPEGDAMTWAISSVPALPPPPAGATFNGSTGTLSWTPNCSDARDYAVAITVTDGLASTSCSFTLHVTCLQATVISVTSNLNLNSNNTLDITFQPTPTGSWNVTDWDRILANTKLTATGFAGYATAASVSISGASSTSTGTASFSATSLASLMSGFSSNTYVQIAMELELRVLGCVARIPFSVKVKKP